MTGADRNYDQTRYMLGGYEIELHHPGGIRTWLLPSREIQLAQLAAIMTTNAVTVAHDKEVQGNVGLDNPRRVRQIRLEHVAGSSQMTGPVAIARILDVARKIGEHWRTQEGVNGALLDELAQLTKEG